MIRAKELCVVESISQLEAIFALARIIGLPLLFALLRSGNGSRTMGSVQNSTVFCPHKSIFSSSKAQDLKKWSEMGILVICFPK